MKKILLSLTLILIAFVGMTFYDPIAEFGDDAPAQAAIVDTSKAAAQMPDGDWLQRAQRKIAEQEYNIHLQKGGKYYSSPNRQNNLRINYFDDGFAIKPRVDSLENWKLDFQVLGLQRGEEQAFCLDGAPAIEVEGNRMLQHFEEGFHIEYKNSAEGMRQNFYVEKKPKGNGPLRLKLQTSGGLFPVANGEDAVNLVEGGGNIGATETKASYSDLKVFDANGSLIQARMEVSEPLLDETSGEWIARIDLVVDDIEARYPLLIDPALAIPAYGSDSAAWEGNQQLALFGTSVSSAGDVNGDGYSDVVIGAYNYDFASFEGAVFVYHGSPIGLDSNAAIVLQGSQAVGQFGWSVSTAGDVNADGYSDIIIGANLASAGQPQEGLAFVYKGSLTGIGPTGILLRSGQNGANFGYSVASAGDVNNDGYSDVVVGAPNFDNTLIDKGAAFVFHGNAQGINTIVATQIEGTQTNEYLGFSVASAGDVNADGFSDLVVGANAYDHFQTDDGAAFVYHGSLLGIDNTIKATLGYNQPNAAMGTSVASAGDVNGDGYSDVIVGAIGFSNPEPNEGGAFIFLGSAIGVSSTIDTILESDQVGAEFGSSVASAGDMNGDGYGDVIVGAKLYDTQNGAAFLYAGAATGVDGTSFTQLQPSTLNAQYGFSVSSAGDVNGDGYSDVLVGAPFYSNGETNEGGAFIYNGRPNANLGAAVATLENTQQGYDMGTWVNSAGDVNGDGFSDVIVSARYYDNGQAGEGAAFIYHGSASGLDTTIAAIVESNQPNAGLGWSVSSAGDVNGDGYSDIVVGAIHYNTYGALFVYHGSPNGIDTTARIILQPDFIAPNFGEKLESLGDVNGDGYADIVAASSTYSNGQSNEGVAIVYHGSPTGILPTPATIIETNQDNAFGGAAASAGDVNGDGYGDLIYGASGYSNDQTNEGVAWVYLGSECGIDTTSPTMIEGAVAGAQFGISVASAGDVNGDGYADVIVGSNTYSNGESNEGASFMFLGSSAGINTVPSAVLESNTSSLQFGNSVASAGDVNGDGYGDIIVGTWNSDSAFIYLGSPIGIEFEPVARLSGSGNFGMSVASAGDVNGDGYSDVVVGAYQYAGVGGAFVYYGNGGNGLMTNPEQFRPGSSTTIAPGGLTGTSGQVALSMNAKSFISRQDGKLVWELAPNGQPFSSAGGKITNSVDSSGASTAYTDMFGTGTTIVEELSGLSPSTDYKWRVRIKYEGSKAITGQIYGPWFYYKSRTPEVPMLGFKTEGFPTPEINILGNSQAILDGDTLPSISDSTDFGTIADCGDTLVRTFTIQNNGNKVLNLASVAITGVNMQEFTLSPPQSTTISAGSSTSFQVTFDPAAMGIRSAVVTIFTDDCDEAAFEFAIQGTGGPDVTSPKFDTCIANQVIPLSMPCIGIIPDFSGTVLATDNCGQATILQPAPWASGTVLSNVDSTYSITLYAQDANGNLDTCTFNLTIAGYAIQAYGNGDSISDGDFSPAFQDSTDFGDISGCRDSTLRQFTVQNIGTTAIRIDSVSFSGTNSTDFKVPIQPRVILGPGNSTGFEVVFDPIGGGQRAAIVNVYANGCTAHPYRYAIRGNVLSAIAPTIFLSYGTIGTTVPFLSYQWYRDSLPMDGQIDSTITPSLPGMYYVQAEDRNGCKNSSSELYFNPYYSEVTRKLFVTYPNPILSEKLFVEPLDTMDLGSAIFVKILNSHGQEMLHFYQEHFNIEEGFNVSHLEPGLYQVVITIPKTNATEGKQETSILSKLR